MLWRNRAALGEAALVPAVWAFLPILALNFLLSSPAHPYEPVPSCSTGTSHAPKQDRRVKAGLDAAYNPFWQLFDHKRLGLAGHSYGAAGVSCHLDAKRNDLRHAIEAPTRKIV